MPTARLPAIAAASPDPRLERALRRLLLLGVLAVALLPAARGHSTWIGSLPLWLVAMPLSSWWALHRCRLPHARMTARMDRRRRRGVAQARRRQVPRSQVRLERVA
ncbi:MAG: hypothetical protein ACJ8GK_12135 [Luteimonas sp.]